MLFEKAGGTEPSSRLGRYVLTGSQAGQGKRKPHRERESRRQAEPAAAKAGAAVGENAATARWRSRQGVLQSTLSFVNYCSWRLSLFFHGLLGVSPVYKELTKA